VTPKQCFCAISARASAKDHKIKVGEMISKTVQEKQILSHITLGFKRSNTEIQQTRRIPCLNFVLCSISLAPGQRLLNELQINREPEAHFNPRLRVRGQINPLLTTGNEEIHTSAHLSAFMIHKQCLYETHIHY